MKTLPHNLPGGKCRNTFDAGTQSFLVDIEDGRRAVQRRQCDDWRTASTIKQMAVTAGFNAIIFNRNGQSIG